MQNLKTADMIALILLIIGGLNWGLVSFGYNVVDMVFGQMSAPSRIIYMLVGLSALYMASIWMKLERK